MTSRKHIQVETYDDWPALREGESDDGNSGSDARLGQTGFLREGEALDEAGLRQALQERFDSIDFKAAARDVMPFLQDASSLHLWTSDFFKQVTEGLKVGRQGGQAM